MEQRECPIILLIALLSLAFALVSALLWLSGGRSFTLLARKMKLGAMLLTLTAAVSCQPKHNKPQAMCYDTETVSASEDAPLSLDNQVNDTTVLVSDSVTEFSGYYATSPAPLRYHIYRDDEQLLYSGTVNVLKNSWTFKFSLMSPLPEGHYRLYFYGDSVEQADTVNFSQKFHLDVKK